MSGFIQAAGAGAASDARRARPEHHLRLLRDIAAVPNLSYGAVGPMDHVMDRSVALDQATLCVALARSVAAARRVEPHRDDWRNGQRIHPEVYVWSHLLASLNHEPLIPRSGPLQLGALSRRATKRGSV